ncbi:MAG: YciI family protein [Cyclobacteriaceae bacterium]
MNEFMLLMRGDDSETASPEEMQKRMGDYMAWIKGLMEEDRFVAGQPLQPTGKLLTNKDTILSDGPFLEPKEIIGGYVILKATNIDEATEMARNCPLLHHCEIMVRPVFDVQGG